MTVPPALSTCVPNADCGPSFENKETPGSGVVRCVWTIKLFPPFMIMIVHMVMMIWTTVNVYIAIGRQFKSTTCNDVLKTLTKNVLGVDGRLAPWLKKVEVCEFMMISVKNKLGWSEVGGERCELQMWRHKGGSRGIHEDKCGKKQT